MARTKLSTETKERKKSKKSRIIASQSIDPTTQSEAEESVAFPNPEKKKSKKSKSAVTNVLESTSEFQVERNSTSEPTEKREKKKSNRTTSTISELSDLAPGTKIDDAPAMQPRTEKEKKEKKSNKDRDSRKSKSSNIGGEKIAALVALSDEDDTNPTKKRKRPETIEDEIEIDVALPEPLSKRAARKAKKAKTIDSHPAQEGADEEAESTIPSSGPKEKKERRTAWGIWIGNLPWSASKSDVKDFLCKHAKLDTHEITRIHMPVPSNAPARNGEKPKNKGFAYLDFNSPEALEAAMKVSETQFNNDQRKVLIKQSTSFEGRPEPKTEDEPKQDDNSLSTLAADKMNGQKPPSKRVFVGNLGFDTTKDDLQNHFGQCGEIADIFMATFEDSGKSKGFAWVTFTTQEAGIAAVRGWIIKNKDQDSDSESEAEAKEDDDTGSGKQTALVAELKAEGYADVDNAETAKILKQRLSKTQQKKKKTHKWFVNKMSGRSLRCEFAEDAGVRYKKRYGKDAQKKDGEVTVMADAGHGAETAVDDAGTWKEKKPQIGKKAAAAAASTPHERRKEARRAANRREFGVAAQVGTPTS